MTTRTLVGTLAVALTAACGSTDGPEDLRASRDAPVTYQSREFGYSVTYPAPWQRARARLTPNLSDPKEILALATFPPPAGGDRCAHQPVAALEAMAPDDALIVVFERHPPWQQRGYPPREGVELSLETGTGRFCVPDPRSRRDAWLSFSDVGRAFYLLVAVGPEAPPETEREAWQIVKSLRFDARGD